MHFFASSRAADLVWEWKKIWKKRCFSNWSIDDFSELSHSKRTHQPVAMVFEDNSINNNNNGSRAHHLCLTAPGDVSQTRWGASICRSASNCPTNVRKWVRERPRSSFNSSTRRWNFPRFAGGAAPRTSFILESLMRTRSSWLEDFSLFGVSWTFQIWRFCFFFGVYLLSIQGIKALSLCFVLQLLYCLSDLYLSLSLVSWFSCKKEKKKKETPCLPFFTVIRSSRHQIHVRRLMLWNFNRSLTSLIQQWQRAERLALGCADSGRLTLPRPQLAPPGDSPWKADTDPL